MSLEMSPLPGVLAASATAGQPAGKGGSVTSTDAFEPGAIPDLREVEEAIAGRVSATLAAEEHWSVLELASRPELLTGLHHFAREQELTLSELVRAAWALLLSRYTGQEQVILAWERWDTDLEASGVIRLACPPELRVEQWLRGSTVTSRDTAFEAGRALPAVESFGFRHRSQPCSGASATEGRLVLELIDDPVTLRLSAPCSRGTREGMLRHLLVLLEELAADPAQPLGRVCYLTAVERQQLLDGWAGSPPRQDGHQLVHRAFEAQVARSPQQIAVTCGAESWTYEQLNLRANRLAHDLQAAGVRAGTPVGVCVGRTLALPWALLGVLKAGGAYVPLDPGYPAERLRMVIEDAGLSLVVCDPPGETVLPRERVRVFTLEPAAGSPEPDGAAAVANPDAPVTGDDLAYVIFTSGSTGRPKGVQIRHRSVLSLFENTREPLGFGAGDTWTVFHSFAFDLSVWEIWGALLHGGRLVLVPAAVAASPEAFCRLLREEQVTILNQTPAALAQLARHLGGDPAAVGELSLRRVFCGGEALPRDLAAQVLEWGVPFWNLYGPTECTVWATLHPVTELPVGQAVVPVGRPIPGTEVYLLDPQGVPVPVGLPGELHLGGTGVALGYLNRAELTAERFINHPFRPEAGACVYRTGDLGRYRPDGSIEFLGRADHQVKVRGFRIECEEIEAALRTHPCVRDAAVVAVASHDGERELLAYCVPGGSGLPEARELREHLGSRLPGYMIPAGFVSLAALPLSPNGKVDRRALVDAPRPSLRAPGEAAASGSGIEATLVRLWGEVLGVSPVRATDDFFELGGQSLRAVRLFTEIERRYGCKLPISTLLEAPTPEQLARVLAHPAAVPHGRSLVAIRTGGHKPPLFCVHAGGGEVVWYRTLAGHLAPDRPVYGFKAQGADGRLPRHDRVEQMAAHYLREMKMVQPQGPYHLAGFSFGGMVVFEMARQLRDLGERVALAALLDSFGPGYPRYRGGGSLPARARRWCYAARKPWLERLAVLRCLPPAERLEWLRAWVCAGQTGASSGKDAEVAGREVTPEECEVLPQELRAVRSSLAQAAVCYRPAPCRGAVTLFRCEQQPGDIYPDRSLGWERYAPQLDIVPVPGSHSVVFEDPWVRVLARKLQARLEPGPGS